MKKINNDLARQVECLLDRLQETEATESDLLMRFDKSIALCSQCLHDLHTKVLGEGFRDEGDEISFFKHVKPVALSRLHYYRKRRELHLAAFNASWSIEQDRLREELVRLRDVMQASNSLLIYYRSENTLYDQQYFLRGAYEWAHCPDPLQFDPVFSTACDRDLAKLLANEMIMEYLDHQIQSNGDPASTPPRKPAGTSLRCTAKIVEVVVLGYALFLIGFFNHGNTTLKEVMQHWGNLLQVDLSNHSQIMTNLLGSKDPFRFLKFLLDRFKKYIDERID